MRSESIEKQSYVILSFFQNPGGQIHFYKAFLPNTGNFKIKSSVSNKYINHDSERLLCFRWKTAQILWILTTCNNNKNRYAQANYCLLLSCNNIELLAISLHKIRFSNPMHLHCKVVRNRERGREIDYATYKGIYIHICFIRQTVPQARKKILFEAYSCLLQSHFNTLCY